MAAINSICRPNISQMFFSSGTMPTSTSQGFNSNLGFNSHPNLSRNLSVGGNFRLKCHSNLSQNLSSWGQSLMRKITSTTEAEAEAEAGSCILAPDFTLKTLGPQPPPMKAHDLHLQKLNEHLELSKWAPPVMLKTIGPQQSRMKIPEHRQMYYESLLELHLAGLELRKLELGKLGMEDTPEKQLEDIWKVKFACAFVVSLLLARKTYGPYCPSCCNNGS